MKARLGTIFTLLALVGGTGGALAVASGSGSESGTSAAASQYVHHHHCRIDGHYYRICPKRYPHHFHCYFNGRYYSHCPYAKGVKGVHAVRHRRVVSFTG